MSSKKPKMSKDKSIETLKRVLNYIAAYRWAVCLSLLLALVTVAFTLYIPILTGKAVDDRKSGKCRFLGTDQYY